MGMEVFEHIHPDAPIVVAEAVWQYSSHLLAGFQSHRGPILTVANWSGQWPGPGGHVESQRLPAQGRREFSTLWSKDFKDEFFTRGLRQWIRAKT